MKNFEKYEKEIKGYGANFMFDTKENKVKGCVAGCSINNCAFKDECSNNNKLKWLYEEYQEPLLTNEEREYLEAVIKPCRDYVEHISRGNTTLHIKVCRNFIASYITIELAHMYKFNGLVIDEKYSLEELGL